jgi:mannose-6-phosphate isomerase-like protein (cupin superfamily)
MTAQFLSLSTVDEERHRTGKAYLECLRMPAMSAGLYVIPRGGADPQQPHQEDELYYVLRGRARMTVEHDTRSVRAGNIIFVPAKVEHRFHDIEEELAVLVVFAPAETQ